MILAIFPNGTDEITKFKGFYSGKPVKVFPHTCYFDVYKIDDRYYWFYDEEMIYHIEDSKQKKVILVSKGDCPRRIIDDFVKIKEVLL